ncbi:hypothetical protein [Agrobacterium tumefaciens]|uniref:hypothetical protein n=1 Tax=Agrobacterium tumefaciens TaxID=358 RepID=UPI001571E67C|nr:hypothetical protein [Agrobacterium tumefaciens]WCJ64417.1 hypothetical protein G6M15_16065 [Agrobacterium tumefaciens]
MSGDCWALLGIKPLSNEEAIRKAYSRRLRDFRPDEDPTGFQLLVEARKQALATVKCRMVDVLIANPSSPDGISTDGVAEGSGSFGNSENPDNPAEPENDSQRAVAPFFLEPTQKEKAGKENLPRLLDELGELISFGRERTRGVAQKGNWRVDKWTELLNRASSELSFAEHANFIQALARGIEGLLPPKGDTIPLSDYTEGKGVAAMVNAIEEGANFSENPGLLTTVCGWQSAKHYFDWLAEAQRGNAILRRSSQGKPAYFNGKIPLFPLEDQPPRLGTIDLNSYYHEALKKGRWPFSFDCTKTLMPSYYIMRSINLWFGLTIFGLTLVTAYLAWGIGKGTDIRLAAVSLLSLLALRLTFGILFRRLTLRSWIKRIIKTDKKHIWDLVRRRNHLQPYSPASQDWPLIFVTGIEIIPIVVGLIILAASSSNIWSNRHLYPLPAEKLVTDMVLPAFDAAIRAEAFSYDSFFDFFQSIRSSKPNGFSTRLITPDIPAGKLSNLLWLPTLTRNQERFLSASSGPTHTALFASLTIDPSANRLHEVRNAKLRVWSFLYRIGTPRMRVDIEKALNEWGPLIRDAKFRNGWPTEQAIWSFMAPELQGPVSADDKKFLRKAVLSEFARQARRYDSKSKPDILYSQFHWLLFAPDTALFQPQSLLADTPLPEIKLDNESIRREALPSNPILSNFLRGWAKGTQPDRPSTISSTDKLQVQPGMFYIARVPDISALAGRRAFFFLLGTILETDNTLLSLKISRRGLAKLPESLPEDTPGFWTTATAYLLRAQQQETGKNLSRFYIEHNSDDDVRTILSRLLDELHGTPEGQKVCNSRVHLPGGSCFDL